ncbi:hypothetical protein HOF65_00740 [bacterium]|nr:hypothetical protein [bacterium]MBT3852571.1 hypothetical protein [bacterium]MBT4632492.1 hypothetical protein [bacterium]MBT6778588.1 hypothetical protein [bacterium]
MFIKTIQAGSISFLKLSCACFQRKSLYKVFVASIDKNISAINLTTSNQLSFQSI